MLGLACADIASIVSTEGPKSAASICGFDGSDFKQEKKNYKKPPKAQDMLCVHLYAGSPPVTSAAICCSATRKCLP